MHRQDQAKAVNLRSISETFHKYGGLVSKHISSENTTLFPVAVKLLTEENYNCINRQFADFTSRTTGGNFLEKYEGIIEKIAI
jgi:hemerythrin-like domain-containing protein